MKPEIQLDSLEAENERLRLRLEEAEQTLGAIRAGEVDSLVVDGPEGLRVYALEGASNSYRVLMESMNEGAATLTEGGLVLYCNGRFARMFGEPLQRVMGSSLLDRVPERARATVGALLRAAGEGESRGEVALLTADGGELPAYLSVNAIEDQGRRVVCMVATDLRAQKRSEEIVKAEQLARSVLEQAAEAIAVCDQNGRIIRASHAAAELCGQNPLLASFDEVFPLAFPEAPDRVPDGAAAAALRGEVFHAVPATLERQPGGTSHLLVSATPLQGGGARPTGCVINMVDVTEARFAQQRLEEADQRKDHFLAVLSHELRNPLAPIKNSLYVLDRAAPGGDQAHRAREVIVRQVDQLSRLVDDLLDVTRINRGKIQLQRGRLELNELVRRAIEDYRSLFEASGVEVRMEPAPGQVFVDADRHRVAQAVGNLLQNAAKFTPRGGRVTAAVSADPQALRAAIRVADTGAGIAPETLARLFEPFMQADTTLDRSKGGLGLGLALVKGLVEQHGGSIEARSAGLGLGSEFIVRLPLDLSGDPSAGAGAAPQEKVRRRVLIIEDNVDAADSLRDVLDFEGHEVAVAYNGPDGIAKARELQPDVVFCDIGLPQMDGYAVARAFRRDEALRRIHLIALSGYALREDLERAMEAGFEQHLAKPPSLEKLIGLLATLGRAT